MNRPRWAKKCGRCRVHEERPLVCRGYPWYGERPRDMPLPHPDCGYLVDITDGTHQ